MAVAEEVLEKFSTLSLTADTADRTLPVFADFPRTYNPKEH